MHGVQFPQINANFKEEGATFLRNKMCKLSMRLYAKIMLKMLKTDDNLHLYMRNL